MRHFHMQDRLDYILSLVSESVLKPLEDIENSAEGILEILTEQLNAPRARVVAVANPLDECSQFEQPRACRAISGRYEPGIIAVNYRSDVHVLLHLLAHHLQAAELGNRYWSNRRAEELKLPWELRPSEIAAEFRAVQLMRRAPPRIWRVWDEELKPKIKELDEALARLRSDLEQLIGQAKSAARRP